jgi:hypothetical protein
VNNGKSLENHQVIPLIDRTEEKWKWNAIIGSKKPSLNSPVIASFSIARYAFHQGLFCSFKADSPFMSLSLSFSCIHAF